MLTDFEMEFRDASLGDKRRSMRLERIGSALALDPGRSFPEAMASEGQLEALYRFLNCDDVTFAGILGPHYRRTASRCDDHEDVLVLHDTTSMEFSGAREGLGRLQTSARRGFFLHASLAVTRDRVPLGVLGAESWVRRGPARGRLNRRHLRQDPERESLRWFRGVSSCEELLLPSKAIHVMDREGDNYDLLAQLQADAVRHVIRMAHDRNLVGTTQKLKERALSSKYVLQREVHVSRRPKARPLDHKGIHPERDARTATLAVSGVSVELKRSNNYAASSPPSLSVNVVTVREVNCPRGLEPIVWFLVTTEPITTPAQLESIVDAYRVRWVIEEFFKALKTGCRFEKRQLESYRSLSNALAIFVPIAARLLALRGAARAASAETCTTLTRRQIRILRGCTSRFMAATPTNEQVYMALAELGGHLRSNGPPGWMILGRALERLLLLEMGWIARSRSDQ